MLDSIPNTYSYGIMNDHKLITNVGIDREKRFNIGLAFIPADGKDILSGILYDTKTKMKYIVASSTDLKLINDSTIFIRPFGDIMYDTPSKKSIKIYDFRDPEMYKDDHLDLHYTFEVIVNCMIYLQYAVDHFNILLDLPELMNSGMFYGKILHNRNRHNIYPYETFSMNILDEKKSKNIVVNENIIGNIYKPIITKKKS